MKEAGESPYTSTNTDSVYLLYWYKSTNTDIKEAGELFGEAALLDDTNGAPPFRYQVLQFTCFTSTKVQIRTPQATAGAPPFRYQVLVHEALR